MTSRPESAPPVARAPDQGLAEESRLLLFRLGGELYGTPLLQVQEIIEKQACKALPYALPHFLGAINLRGQITMVVDLCRRFGIKETESPHQVFIVFTTEDGLCAGLVDKVEAVAGVVSADIEAAPMVNSNIPHAYLAGIAKHGDELVSILKLQQLLNDGDIVRNDLALPAA